MISQLTRTLGRAAYLAKFECSRSHGRGARRRMLANLIGAGLMTVAISSPPASTAHAIGSTISPRMQVLIEAPIALSKTNGQRRSESASACSSTSSLTIEELRCGHIGFELSGTWMGSVRFGTSPTTERGAEMPNDKFDKLGPLFANIGSEVAKIVGGDPDGAYLYVEAGDGWYGASVFKDEGEIVRYFDPSSKLDDLIYEAWLTEEPAKRWVVMEYEVEGANFDARFKFPDEVDVESFDEDRREIALKNRYGDKPVIYPPMPPEQSAV